MGKHKTRYFRVGVLDVEILRTGVLLSGHANPRHLPAGADPLPVGVPSNIAVANVEGVAELFARQDHVHNHPAGLGFALHHDHYYRTIPPLEMFPNSTATIGTGAVFLFPVNIPFRLTINGMGVISNVGAGPNCRVGIYADNGDTPVGGALLCETGSFAIGAWSKTEAVIAPATLVLDPALVWFALQVDTDATEFMGVTSNIASGGTLFARTYALAYGAFTNPCPDAGGLFESVPLPYALVSAIG